MQYIAMKTTDIRTNLATEQYLMHSNKMTPPFMLFYIEEPCIIVGRNQNTMEEIDPEYCRQHNITITRRLSGGGAMYQDLGNMCFSMVVPAKDQKFGDFKAMVAPVVAALKEMGAEDIEVTGRNDIVLDGRKFSGNAMYTRDGKTFSHGTCMFDVDTDVVASALRVPKDKIESKGIKSVRSRVINIKSYLKEEYRQMDTFQLRDELIKKIWKTETIEEAQEKYAYTLDDEDQAEIAKIEKEIYYNWDWVYGKSPKFTVKRRKHFTGGTIDARFNVQNGVIDNLVIYGDFFGPENVDAVQDLLKGSKYAQAEIKEKLNSVDLNRFFSGIPQDEIVALLSTQQ
ncbi:lipoate-protein ligase A [Ligilactobacillus salitolerans]|uniref:lipoate--protein ligase n=1 Tax=Ligilactobacillus salitolerans TaxID=1808352 RepID=A0A401IQ35_9LACO|nr:lipoate--protein ligase [Ligilactobacillus salitolerans]GBG93648.1 lipoate-protein ligase A [Ligilactobacillus salitolerans]